MIVHYPPLSIDRILDLASLHYSYHPRTVVPLTSAGSCHIGQAATACQHLRATKSNLRRSFLVSVVGYLFKNLFLW